MTQPDHTARVFISSTTDDLVAFRARARDAAIAAGLFPVMMEDFTASGALPPLGECIARVSECDVLIVIVAHRYGWTPKGKRGKSITWLECEEAVSRGKEVLAFLVDEKYDWPSSQRESHRAATALENDSDTPQLLTEVKRTIAKLGEFKQWLNGRGIRGTFSTPEDLRPKVESALRDWRDRNRKSAGPVEQPADLSVYRDQLREQCSWIDIRGLQVGTGRAYRIPIEELYIPLTMAGDLPLEQELMNPKLVVVGDPGSGKTTFLRHVALDHLNAGRSLPIFIRIYELAVHIRRQPASPRQEDSPAWLIHFLTMRSEEMNQGLNEAFFREMLEKRSSILLLDGLDEAPGDAERVSMVRLVENATQAYRHCRFVVTTRPLSYKSRAVLLGFTIAQIEPLATSAIERFLEQWCAALFPESAAAAKRHLGELTEALRAVPEIRRMARNPVMLTALAVVHWNERRLPEQRAHLYESILTWLARARERRQGRESAERCLTLLRELALAMQRDPKEQQVEVEKGRAAELLAPQFKGPTEAERRELALQFMEQEEMDSGIVVSDGAAVRFWHLTFQEYLAARAIAGLEDTDQRELLLGEDRIYRPEWREVALLLQGVLVRQGAAKVDGLFTAVLDRLGSNAELADKARCAGLLGAMVHDLEPLAYQPADARYRELMDAVLGIFDREKAESVDFAVRLEAAEALGQAGDPRLWQDNWVRIPAGSTLKAFDIGRYPVTVAEYRRFLKDDGYEDEQWWKAGGYGQNAEPDGWEEQNEHPNRPVTGVSWHEAKAYCAWAEVRLPVEAEWERAAHGTEGRKYTWGNEDPDPTRANIRGSGPEHPTPVGLYPAGATPDGILDLGGNVWEWAADRYEKDKPRVLRGGLYYAPDSPMGSTEDERCHPTFRDVIFGFRVARDALVP